VEHNLGEYEKALEINRKLFLRDHSEFANTCNNIALTYTIIGDYTKALEFYEKSLEIRQNIYVQLEFN
jgi:tetratricopeptide (TPR) repeat protein